MSKDRMVDVDALYQRIWQGVLSAAPTGWESVRVIARVLASQAEIEVTYSLASGVSSRGKVPIDVLDAFEELRELLSQPRKGAWYTAICEIDLAGEFSVNFDYDNRPEFSHHIYDEDFLEDLQEFPRDPEFIPSWIPKTT